MNVQKLEDINTLTTMNIINKDFTRFKYKKKRKKVNICTK